MNVTRVLKPAFVFSVVIYAVVALIVLGTPRWDTPWIPEDSSRATLVLVFSAMAVMTWTAGLVFGRRKPGSPGAGGDPAQQRFIVAAAFVEAGAIFGLVLSFLNQDARYAILFAVPTALLILMLPTESPEPRSSEHEGPPPIE